MTMKATQPTSAQNNRHPDILAQPPDSPVTLASDRPCHDGPRSARNWNTSHRPPQEGRSIECMRPSLYRFYRYNQQYGIGQDEYRIFDRRQGLPLAARGDERDGFNNKSGATTR